MSIPLNIPIHTTIDLLTSSSSSSSSSCTHTNNANNNRIECLFNDYVIISSDTRFNDLSQTIYQTIQLKINKLNFKINECYLIIKNWKPILLDQISSNVDNTVYDTLGHLIGNIQLNIRIALKDSNDLNQSNTNTNLFEHKLMLNTFLYQLQSMLHSSTPHQQQLQNGDLNCTYNLYGQLASLLINSNTSVQAQNGTTLSEDVKQEPLNLTQATTSLTSSKSSLISSNTNNNSNNNLSTSIVKVDKTHVNHMKTHLSSSSSSSKRQRERTTFDPQEEIPRLMDIFEATHHPTRFQIQSICDTLNSLECRRGKKPLEPYNIQYWFKNSRAALRRKLKLDQNQDCCEVDIEEEDEEDDDDDNEMGEEDEENVDEGEDDEYENDCESSCESLPNKNAIYVINPSSLVCNPNDKLNEASSPTTDNDDDDHLSIDVSVSQMNDKSLTINLPNNNNNNTSNSSINGNRRNRIFIDPISEVPILEEYFQRETYPDHYLIEKICNDLNRGEYRLKFPKLEARNIQLWFKNHRAKLKRLKVLNTNNGHSTLAKSLTSGTSAGVSSTNGSPLSS